MVRVVVVLDDSDEEEIGPKQTEFQDRDPPVQASLSISSPAAVRSPSKRYSFSNLQVSPTTPDEVPYQPPSNTSSSKVCAPSLESPQTCNREAEIGYADTKTSGSLSKQLLISATPMNAGKMSQTSREGDRRVETSGPEHVSTNPISQIEPVSIGSTGEGSRSSYEQAQPGDRGRCTSSTTAPMPNVDLTLDTNETNSIQDDSTYPKSGTSFQSPILTRPVSPQRYHVQDRSATAQVTGFLSPRRNMPITFPMKSLDNYTHNGIRLNPKTCVELIDGDFLRIVDIMQNSSTLNVSLRGCIFRRTRYMNGLFERKLNELCWILHVDEDDPRDHATQAMITIPVDSIKGRRKIRMTNKIFPAHSFREDSGQEDEATIYQERVLVCRFKYVCHYFDTQARERNAWSEKAIHRLRAEECDIGLAESDEQLRFGWRGQTEKGGAKKPPIVTLAQRLNEMQMRQEAGDEEVVELQPSTRGQKSQRKRKRDDLQPLTSTKENDLAHGIQSMDWTANEESPPSTPGKDHNLIESDTFHKGIFELLSPPIPRSSSPETVEIDLRIKTTTKRGTLERKCKGRITSTFTPHDPTAIKDEDVQELERPSKVSKVRHLLSEDQAIKHQSSSLPTSESTQGNPSPALKDRRSIPGSQMPDSHLPLYKQSFVTSFCPTIPSSPEHFTTKVKHGPGNQGSISSSPSPSSPADSRKSREPSKYTFGDCFCGGGGMSRGALMAGLDVQWGFDSNPHACDTYVSNFPLAKTYLNWAHEISGLIGSFKVDICHLSPPCQFFSPAHTVMGKDDEMNVASLFAIQELLKKAQPRICTLEQTSGLLSGHEMYFNAVVNIFITIGFSIRWRLLNCADFDVPQRRRRIFMIASCPGEPLPPFPKPPCSATPEMTGLKPYKTINAAIANIPLTADNHDLNATTPKNEQPYDGNALAPCMTTSSSRNLHPSGARDFTHRELACLQGFPLEHELGSKNRRMMIGNAVPPIVAKAILESVKGALMKEDGIAVENSTDHQRRGSLVEID